MTSSPEGQPSDVLAPLVRRAPLVLVLIGALLLLPRLGSFGLWDPTEVRIADAARNAIEPGQRAPNQAPSTVVLLVAHGFQRLGVGEWGGRLPLALVSLLALLATYWLGRAVLRPRAALLGAVALATMPSFLLGGRQLTSNAPMLLAVALTLGGLARIAWPPAAGGAATLGLGALGAAAGLALGVRTGGLIVGALVPVLAVAIARACSAAQRRRALPWFVAAGLLAAWIVVLLRNHAVYSPWLGGVPRAPQYQTVLTTLLRQLGFAAAPWLAFAPFAILSALDGKQPVPEGDDPERAPYARALLPAALGTMYLGATLHSATLADLVVPATPLLGLLAGAWLDEALLGRGERAIEGLVIAVLALTLGHDIMLTTDAFVSVLASEQLRWPQPLYWTGNVLFGALTLSGALVGAALMLPLVSTDVDAMGRRRAQTSLLVGAVVAQLAFGVLIGQWFIPTASRHLSPKDLYGKTRQLDPKAPLGQYRFHATGAAYYMQGRTATQLGTLDDVLTFLRRPERVFIFIGGEELASIDQATRGGTAGGLDYFVVDDSNTHFLILSNRLPPNEKDRNPLRRFITTTPPSPKTPLVVNFDDKLKLLGYELPAEARRGEDVRVRLYFEVLQPVGGAYKVFLHFDGPGARVNGDHVPLDGKFPTQYWTPGTYVLDEYLLKPDRATQPAGVFQLFFGLYSGDKRLKVKDGASDGENRIRLGAVRVK